MKLSQSAALLVVTATNVVVAMTTQVSKQAQQHLWQNARRVQQNGQNYYYGGNGGGQQQQYGYGGGGGGEGENWWLADYSIKMVACLSGEQSINYERGEVQSSTVIFRLCPKNTCSSNSTLGCDAGYGDYAIGINTYAEAFAESVRDNYAYWEVNQMKDYLRECRALGGDGGGGGGNGGNGYYYGGNGYTYIGPACSADGKNIRLATFSDPYCQYESDVTNSFYGGNAMPFSNGGLIPETCMNCFTQNYDNYEWEVSDMCRKTIEDASYRCESNMDFSSRSYYYYGPATSGCNYLESKVQSSSSGSNNYLSGSMFTDESGQPRETVRTVLLFLTAACVSAVVVLVCVQKKRRARKARAAKFENDGLEIISPQEAMESIQKGQQSAKTFVASAAKKVKQSVHDTAKRVVSFTRSSSNAVVRKTNRDASADTDEEDSQNDGNYQSMEASDGRNQA